jgi:hypothetical protein
MLLKNKKTANPFNLKSWQSGGPVTKSDLNP